MIDADSRLGHLAFWLSMGFLVFLLSGLILYRGAWETVIEISSTGWCVIGGVAAVSGVLMLVAMVRGSRSGSLDAGLVLLRKLRTGAWLLRILATSVAVALFVALCSWTWVLFGVRNLPATFAEVTGEVVGFSRASTSASWCRFYIHVRFKDAKLEEICAERGLIARSAPEYLMALKQGDSVRVLLRSTLLGTGASILDPAGH